MKSTQKQPNCKKRYHHSHFWAATFDFTTFFMLSFVHGLHLFLQFDYFCIKLSKHSIATYMHASMHTRITAVHVALLFSLLISRQVWFMRLDPMQWQWCSQYGQRNFDIINRYNYRSPLEYVAKHTYCGHMLSSIPIIIFSFDVACIDGIISCIRKWTDYWSQIRKEQCWSQQWPCRDVNEIHVA